MSCEIPIPELAKREKNFFSSNIVETSEQIAHYTKLQKFIEQIELDLDIYKEMSNDHTLRMIFTHIFNFVIVSNDIYYDIFSSNQDIYDAVFEAGLFTTLCMFLYDTRRLKGMSLRKFIYEHSSKRYNKEGSNCYFKWDKSTKEYDNLHYRSLLSDDQKLRQYRRRLLSSRNIYNHSSEWSAIRKGSEHEWELYFILEEQGIKEENSELYKFHDIAQKTRTLYKEICNSQKPSNDDELMAYQKFLKKLNKLHYEQVLKLYQFYLEHIQKNPTYYGINLYRFERQTCLYSLTNEVNQLLKFQSKDERDLILLKSVLLKDIHFPKLYEHFSNLEETDHIAFYVDTFLAFMKELVLTSRLVIDKFIDEVLFGEDWEKLFLDIINEMAENVLYDPQTINYSVAPDFQSAFEEIITAPVLMKIGSRLQRESYFEESDNDL